MKISEIDDAWHAKNGLTPPYLAIRVMPGVFTFRRIGENSSREDAIAIGWKAIEYFKRRFRVCVVFGPTDAVYLEVDEQIRSGTAPSGGITLDAPTMIRESGDSASG